MTPISFEAHINALTEATEKLWEANERVLEARRGVHAATERARTTAQVTRELVATARHCREVTDGMIAKAAGITQALSFGEQRADRQVPAPHLLDTPANRRLLAALDAAVEAANEVDRERGWIDADGASVGIGETLAGMALTTSVEVFGPGGRD